jgi:predicted short-subunit dehydrogenase-like oxidoreductase (DUF2520 family)
MAQDDPVRPARLAVGLVSAGRAGTSVAAAFDRVGHPVIAVSAVSDASRARAATLLPDAVVRDPREVAERSELLVLAVPDDVLAELVRGLAQVGAVRPGTLVAHLSGAHGHEVLEPLTTQGALPLALHPAMTFTGTAIDLERLDGCPWAVTAPEPLRPVAESLVVETGGEPEWVPAAQRVRYHAALCHAANHLVTLVAQAQDQLSAAGVVAERRFLGPLLSAALDNALRAGDAALTGPVARGDAGTVAAHVAALAASDAVSADAYVALARATALRAGASRRLTSEQVEAILRSLQGSGPEGEAA